MDINNSAMLERQISINRAFGRMYFAIYSVDMKSGYYLEVSTLDIFKEHIPPTEKNQLLFDMVVKYYVSGGYKDGMRDFLNMDTLQERLKEQNAVSNDFFGTTQGWCRASFVVEKRAENGLVERFVYVTQEINQEVKSEQERIAELKNAYAAADAANQAKSDFLFRMSHDIRTPLNAIMGFENLIANCAEEPEKVREYAEKIRVSGNLLLSLLNEILDMTKIESGTVVLENLAFSMDDLIAELDMVFRSQAAEKNQVFAVRRQMKRCGRFTGDRVRISRVLFNILGNAVKYTPKGGRIDFTIREEDSDLDGKVMFVFSIKDTGAGIAPEYQDKIFEEFQRGVGEAVSQTQGTGLGLPIAKSFTEMMGGEILLKSTPGTGSEFIVRIPLRPEAKSEQKEGPQNEEDDILNGLKILIVEDNELNREILTELLAMAGTTCEAAGSGSCAIECIKNCGKKPYDLIIMDVSMPEMDGYETTRRIRAMEDEGLKKIPIVALTANAFEEDVKNAIKAGMDAHLAKPLDMNLLKKTARRLLKGC